jgi:hypothetical protein
MSAHTPGPWREVCNHYSRYEIHYAGGQLAGVAKWDDPASPPPIPEMHANARLIAAAPDQNEALIEVETYFAERADAEYFTDSASPVGNEEMRLLVIVRAALAKATGEQP